MVAPFSGSPIRQAGPTSLIDVPDLRQEHAYDCGAAALRTIAAYFGVGVDDQDWFIDLLGTNTADGTRPTRLIEAAHRLGLRTEEFHGDTEMTELARHLEAGHPVLCPMQAGGRLIDRDSEREGHYVIVRGLDDEEVYLQDPAVGRRSMTRAEFGANWHDHDAAGKAWDHWGLAFIGAPAKRVFALLDGRPVELTVPALVLRAILKDADEEQERLELLADILGGLAGESALAALEPTPAKDFSPCRDEQGRFTSCGDGGVVDSTERDRRVQDAHEHIGTILREGHTPEKLRTLTDKLSKLTVKQLREIKAKHGLSASPRLKADLVAKLRDHLAGQAQSEPAKPDQHPDEQALAATDHAKENEAIRAAQGLTAKLAAFKSGDLLVGRLVRIGEEHHQKMEAAQQAQEAFTRHYNSIPLRKPKPDQLAESQRLQQAAIKASQAVKESEKSFSSQAMEALKSPQPVGLQKDVVDVKNPELRQHAAEVFDQIAQAVGPSASGEKYQFKVKFSSDPEATRSFNRYGHVVMSDDIIGKRGTDEARAVIAHELGHSLEYHSPAVLQHATEFVEQRIARSGTPDRRLAEVLPNHGYREDEIGNQDDFGKVFGEHDSWYVGKRYEGIDGKPAGTEIVSMGLEQMFRDPVRFAKTDPEYAKLIVGILTGKLR